MCNVLLIFNFNYIFLIKCRGKFILSSIKERDPIKCKHSYIRIVIVCNTSHHYIAHNPTSINTKDGCYPYATYIIIQNYLISQLT
jgi:hypothetical protein